MTDRCSEHCAPGDPPGGEILWSLLIPPDKTALFLCVAGHYVRVWGACDPSFSHMEAVVA